jgi:hypothetical protein
MSRTLEVSDTVFNKLTGLATAAQEPPEKVLEILVTHGINGEIARRRADQFLLRKVGDLLYAEEPSLHFGERVCWKVPVALTNPERGRVGTIGELRIDAETGEVLAGRDEIEQLERNAITLYHAASL